MTAMTATIIKAGNPATKASGLYSLDLRDIAGQAEAMLAAARIESARIIEEAGRETQRQRVAALESARREGHAEGVAAGREEGHSQALREAREQFKKEQGSLRTTLARLLQSVSARRDRMHAEARQDVIVLAIAVARRICGRLIAEPAAASAAATAACDEALTLLGAATNGIIRVHPEEAAAMRRLAEDVSVAIEAASNLSIVEDASVSRGGVVLESGNSRIDATVSERLDRIADELVSGWRDRLKELSLES
jgi:flagellar assembly protein FliH